MATETLKKVAAQIELENGLDAKGEMRYVKQTIQYVGRAGYDGDKLLAVVGALEPCLAKDLSSTNVVKTLTVSAS